MFFSNLTVSAASTDLTQVCLTLTGANSSTFMLQVAAPTFPIYLGQKFTARICQDEESINQEPTDNAISILGILCDNGNQDNSINCYSFYHAYRDEDGNELSADVVQANFVLPRDAQPFYLGYAYRLEFVPA